MAYIPNFTYFIFYYILKDILNVQLNKNLRITRSLQNTIAIIPTNVKRSILVYLNKIKSMFTFFIKNYSYFFKSRVS